MAQKNGMAAFISIGFEIIGILLIAAWLGSWLDTAYELKGMGTAGLVILGLVGWLVHLLYMLKDLDNDQSES